MKKKLPIFLLILTILLLSGSFVSLAYSNYFQVSYQITNDFAETAQDLANPYQGWYHIYAYTLADAVGPSAEQLASQREESADNALALVQINLKNYALGDISQTALNQLDGILSAWKQGDTRLILRFLYDWDGNAQATEPKSADIVRRHMEQTAQVVNRHADLIYSLQGIYVGNYGEMHGSDYLDGATMRSLASYLADLTDSSIYLAVRTPQHWRSIVQSMSPLDAAQAHDGSLASRLGLFNDGMLGSESDLGTYGNASLSEASKDSYDTKGSRSEELSFQHSLCQYVPNGGEVVSDNPYNDPDRALADLAQMHVSYLNMDYDSSVLNKWKNAVYQGDDCYKGMSVYDYIGKHLGYRYVLTASSCTFHPWKNKTATLKLTIDNAGFANACRRFDVTLRLIRQETNEKLDIPVDTDNRLWGTDKNTKLKIPLDIRSYGVGSYSVHLSVTDPKTGEDILLATNCIRSKDGYHIADLEITK